MKIKKSKIKPLITEIEELIQLCEKAESSHDLSLIHPEFKLSARNLLHYRALRTVDLTNLQKRLGELGLSRFARSQSHVMASLKSMLFRLVFCVTLYVRGKTDVLNQCLCIA